MSNLLQDYEALSRIGSESDLLVSLQRLAGKLGFDHFICGIQMLSVEGKTYTPILNGYPCAWRERYVSANYIDIDPVMLHCRRQATPLIWAPHLFSAGAARHLMEEARGFGLKAGVSFPVHGVGGELGVLSLALESDSDAAGRHLAASLAEGGLLASYAYESLRRLVNTGDGKTERFSERELECLRWAALGKSNWDISRILGISEHGVSHHIRSVLRKFAVTSRSQAVMRALALNLLRL